MLTDSRSQRTPLARGLIFANAILFLLEQYQPALERQFALSWSGLMQGQVWQLLTYQFLHWNLLHIVVNMLGLWFAARTLEPLLGPKKFLLLYLVSGGIGGLVQVLLVPNSLVIGASGAVCGLIATFSALYPELRITALLFFVIPVRLKAKWLGYGIILLSVLFLVTGWAEGIGNAAHLGGAITGYLFVWFSRSRHS